MEDTLGVLDKLADAMLGIVLILVLMEDTLGGRAERHRGFESLS